MCILILLTSCTSQSSLTPTKIPVLISPDTPLPFKTATQTPVLTDSPTQMPTLTWTPLPTMSVQQVNEKIKELLSTNGGCELPCWWGIIPNKTVWTELLHSITPFIVNLEQSKPYVKLENNKRHTYQEVQFYYYLPDNISKARMTLGVKDNIVFAMTIYSPGAEYNYQLHQLLELLGPPKKILINAQSSSPISELPPAVITLDYSDIGVWASFGYIPIKDKEKLVICPKSSLGRETIYDNLGSRLRLFDPSLDFDNTFSIFDYANSVGGFSAKEIEDATNMDIETFYATFINPNTKICLETPTNLWP